MSDLSEKCYNKNYLSNVILRTDFHLPILETDDLSLAEEIVSSIKPAYPIPEPENVSDITGNVTLVPG